MAGGNVEGMSGFGEAVIIELGVSRYAAFNMTAPTPNA
jgi:hypothetical protein